MGINLQTIEYYSLDGGMNLMMPMNQKTVRMFIIGMEELKTGVILDAKESEAVTI